MVSLMTALWFAHLEAPDRVSVKPHASPVLHAINYLLGRLDRRYLTTLREYGGLQSYPSRTKDPDPVDYSTGSVGIGATAPIWGALAHRYVAGHFEVPRGGRQIALIGDAELDEGACWEAIADPMVAKLGEVMWVVDLNRQSLDRVVPDIAAGRLAAMFEAAGWHCVMVKYGPRLAAPPAAARAHRRDAQRGVPAAAARGRGRAARAPRGRRLRPRRRRAAGHLPRPRRPRPRRAGRRLPPGRRRAAAARPSCSPTRSRAGCCRPRATRPTTRALLNAEQYAQLADDARHRPGGPVGGVRRRLARGGAVRGDRPAAGPAGAEVRRPTRPRCPTTSAASTRARSPPSRRSGASSSTSCARRPRWPTAS